MPVSVRVVVERPTPDEIRTFITAFWKAGQPGTPALWAFQRDLMNLVRDDYKTMLLGNYDRTLANRAPLAPATWRGRAGSGPSLIPRGLSSRFWTRWQFDWYGSQSWNPLLSVGWDGLPFAPFHLTGARRGRWVLPRRDVGGLTPAGRDGLRPVMRKFLRDLSVTATSAG